MGISRIWNRAAAALALIGGLQAGLLPGSAGAAPADIRLDTLPSSTDTENILPLRRAAVAGTIFDVQNYLRKEMEASYPGLKGTLAFLP